jgi:hypothetical protein
MLVNKLPLFNKVASELLHHLNRIQVIVVCPALYLAGAAHGAFEYNLLHRLRVILESSRNDRVRKDNPASGRIGVEVAETDRGAIL